MISTESPHETKWSGGSVNTIDYGAFIGMVLGDGYIKPYTKKAAFSLGHSLKQKEYALFKVEFLKLPYTYRIYNTKKQNQNPHIDILTKSSNELMELRNEIYANRKKRITLDILNRLTPLGLAFWYCDDGTYYNGAITISTNCFNYDEHKIMVDYFASLNIKAQVMRNKRNYYYICFNRVNTLYFLKYIYPYCNNFPDSIKYKFGPLWEGNTERLNQIRQNINNKARLYHQKNKEKRKSYYLNKKEEVLIRHKKRYELNKEVILAKQHLYYQKHKEEIKLKKKEYYQKNKEQIYCTSRKWVLQHRDKTRAYKKRHRDTHKKERLEYQRRYRLQKRQGGN